MAEGRFGRYLGVYSLDLPGSRDSFATRGLIDDTISGFRILSVEIFLGGRQDLENPCAEADYYVENVR